MSSLFRETLRRDRVVDLNTAPQMLAFGNHALMTGVNIIRIMGRFVLKLNNQRDRISVIYRPAGRAAWDAERHFENAGMSDKFLRQASIVVCAPPFMLSSFSQK